MQRLFRKLAKLLAGAKDKGTNAPRHAPAIRSILTGDLDKNINTLQQAVPDGAGVVYRKFTVHGQERIPAAIVYIDGLANLQTVDTQVLRTLMLQVKPGGRKDDLTRDNALDVARDSIVSTAAVTTTAAVDDIVFSVLSGDTILMFDGTAEALTIETEGWQQRSIEAPESQSVVRGPRDGFVETLLTNMALVRRRLRDHRLQFDMMKIGRRSQTDVAVGYIADIANPETVAEVKKRLETIDVDGIMESGQIEELIEDEWLTVFPTTEETERPDHVAASLLQGRIVIMVDNTPFAVIVPTTFAFFLSAAEDYYIRWPIATALRLLRYAAVFGSLVLPSAYVAAISFHPALIPTQLAITMGMARANVPFPAVFEAFGMEVALELLREAGIRLPGPIGQAIGIVGAIIIGQAAVEAGLVSPIMVIVVATTAIASFVVPTYSFTTAFRLLRFGLLILAGTVGLYGLIIGLLLILAHLSVLKSFGTPYLVPYAPFLPADWNDSVVRLPEAGMRKRPSFLKPQDSIRMQDERHADVPPPGRKGT